MPTESVVFIVVFALAFAAIAVAIFTLAAKSRAEKRSSDAAEEESLAQQDTPEAKERAARADIAGIKAEALGAIEADEAAGRTPRRTGNRVTSYRRKVLRQIDSHNA